MIAKSVRDQDKCVYNIYLIFSYNYYPTFPESKDSAQDGSQKVEYQNYKVQNHQIWNIKAYIKSTS